MTEWRVFFHDVGLGNSWIQEIAENLVGRARIDVVRAEQYERFALPPLRSSDIRRRELPVGLAQLRCRKRSSTVLLPRTAPDKIANRSVPRKPATRFCATPKSSSQKPPLPCPGQQLSRFFREEWPIGCRIDHHRLELPAQDSAFSVDLVDRHQRHVFEHVSLIAMVPLSEWSTPTLIVSLLCALTESRIPSRDCDEIAKSLDLFAPALRTLRHCFSFRYSSYYLHSLQLFILLMFASHSPVPTPTRIEFMFGT